MTGWSKKSLYVDKKKYFVINRGRQYGKTTTLKELANYIRNDYLVVTMDFQEIGTEDFASTEKFVHAFSQKFLAAVEAADENKNGFMEALKDFMDFLSQLRGYYLDRDRKATFHSVILAGVYDIKNLKLKIRSDEEHRYNSPWNIATDFTIDMNFTAEQIADMLNEYEADNHTGMDVGNVSQNIFEYTSGYPYLVSAVCKLLDEDICISKEGSASAKAWNTESIVEAIKILLNKPLPLFQSMIRQMNEYPDLKKMLNALLFQGKQITFNIDNSVIELASMFGYVVNKMGFIQVANRIFEMRLYSYFLSEEELTNAIYDEAQGNKSRYFLNGRLSMELVLENSIINGTGNECWKR